MATNDPLTPARLAGLCEMCCEQATHGPYTVERVKNSLWKIMGVFDSAAGPVPSLFADSMTKCQAEYLCNLLNAFPALARAALSWFEPDDNEMIEEVWETYNSLCELVARCEAAQEGEPHEHD